MINKFSYYSKLTVICLRYVIPFLLLVTTLQCFAKSSPYQGKVATYTTSSNNKLALHEHGFFHNFDTKTATYQSYIEVIDLKARVRLAFLDNTPNFAILAWTKEEKYLVGLTNKLHTLTPNPSIVVYNSRLEQLKSITFECHDNNAVDSHYLIKNYFCADNISFSKVAKLNSNFNISVEASSLFIRMDTHVLEITGIVLEE